MSCFESYYVESDDTRLQRIIGVYVAVRIFCLVWCQCRTMKCARSRSVDIAVVNHIYILAKVVIRHRHKSMCAILPRCVRRRPVLRGHPRALRQEEAYGGARRSSGDQDGARPPLLRARSAVGGGGLAARRPHQASRGEEQAFLACQMRRKRRLYTLRNVHVFLHGKSYRGFCIKRAMIVNMPDIFSQISIAVSSFFS